MGAKLLTGRQQIVVAEAAGPVELIDEEEMKRNGEWFTKLMFVAMSLAVAGPSRADTTIATFDDFDLDGLFASWGAVSATVVSGPTVYSITSSGFGSGFEDINPNLDATGETTIELSVTLEGNAGENDPVSGPIVSLVDADGTFFNYAWYGRSAGTHLLTADLSLPTFTSAPGSVPGLDLSKLDFFHLQNDPGAYQGDYTIRFENLRLTGAAGLTITSASYDPSTQEFTLTWMSKPDKTYTLLHASEVTGAFGSLANGINSGGVSTTTTVTMPAGGSGFLRVQEE
jgi:hypothetical protein